MDSSDFDTAVIRTSDERCDLAAFAWGSEYAHRHGGEPHLVTRSQVSRFTQGHPASVIVVGVRPDHSGSDSHEVVGLARDTGRPVVVVPVAADRERT